MKKLIITISLIVFCCMAVNAAEQKRNVSSSAFSAVVNKYEGSEGFNTLNVGRFLMGMAKTMIRTSMAADGDTEAAELSRFLRGIKKITIIDYEECNSKIRSDFSRDLENVLSASDCLFEAKDDGEVVRLYGIVSDDGDTLSDFVLYVPSDCAVIRMSGVVSMSTLSSLMSTM